MTDSDRFDDGMQVRREVLGDDYVDGASERATPFTADFQRFITEMAWGTVWTRPGLDRRTRSAITITSLVAHGHWDELALHVVGARRNGLSEDEIAEVLLHTTVYCGVPSANRAFAIARDALAGLPDPPDGP